MWYLFNENVMVFVLLDVGWGEMGGFVSGDVRWRLSCPRLVVVVEGEGTS